MTAYLMPHDIAERVAEIKAQAGDAEAAHGAEDALYVRVLRDIAAGHPFPCSAAATALQAVDLDFPRWCA